MRPEITTIVLTVLAVALGIVAYLRDPGLPGLILAGMLQVLVPQGVVPVLAGRLVEAFYQE